MIYWDNESLTGDSREFNELKVYYFFKFNF
jgi:hypothetical protein